MRRILRRSVCADGVGGKVTGFENAVLHLLCAAAAVTVFTAVRGELSFRLLPSNVFPALLLGLVNAGIGCGCYFLSIGAFPAQTVAVFGCTELLFAVLLSMLILHEPMQPLEIVSAIFRECSRKKRIV